jgi:hypothetical protein
MVFRGGSILLHKFNAEIVLIPGHTLFFDDANTVHIYEGEAHDNT